jgi:hypothetical protein
LRGPGQDKPEDQQVKGERELDAVSKPPAARRKPKHLSKYPLRKKSSRFPETGIAINSLKPYKGFGHPENGMVEVKIANVEVV